MAAGLRDHPPGAGPGAGRSPRGLATPALLAHVLVSKYLRSSAALPAKPDLARHGVEIEPLDPCQLGRRRLLVAGAAAEKGLLSTSSLRKKLFADDTPIPVLDPGRGRTKTGRLWVYARDDRPWQGPDPPGLPFYLYSPDRKAERPLAHLADSRARFQVDGYPGFEQLGADIRLAACWAHARRKFYEVHQATGLADRS